MRSLSFRFRDIVAAAAVIILSACVTERPPEEGLRAPQQFDQSSVECPSGISAGRFASEMFLTGAKLYQQDDMASALIAWRKAALAGDALAQYNLAVMLENGNGETASAGLAACWYRQSSAQGYAPAQNNLGILYQDGRGVAQDYVRAADYYQSAAESGLAPAQRHLAILLEAGWGVPRDPAEALMWLKRSAEKGYPPAARTLGMWLDAGSVIDRDFEQAISWTEKAIKDGDADALSNLGWFYFRDQGGVQDLGTAIKNFEESAAKGARTGQYNLALAYFDGKGVPEDRPQAIKLWRQSAKQGFHPAMNWLGTAYDRGWGVQQDPKKALEWYIRAHEAGSVDALNNLGVAFRDGVGVNKDLARAEAFFHKADRRGHIMAAVNLAAKLEASGYSFDDKRSFKFYMKSANRGLAHAQAKVAQFYEAGTGVEENLVNAYMWYSLSKTGNMGQAQSIDSYGAARAGLLADRGINRLKTKLTAQQIETAETATTYFQPKVLHGLNVVRGRADAINVVLNPDDTLVQFSPNGIRYSERLTQPVKEVASAIASSAAADVSPKLTQAALNMSRAVETVSTTSERCQLINELKTSVDLPADCQITQTMLDALTENLSGLAVTAAKDIPKTRVLLVGIEEYSAPAGKRSWPNLQYPVRDIERIANLLKNEFAMDVTVLKNPKTKKEVEAVFWDVHSSIQPMDQFLFIWSGHGIYSDWRGQGYLALSSTPMNVALENQQAFLADSKGDAYYHNYLSYNDIHAFLSGIDADVLFLVDACQSGLADVDATFRRGQTKGILVEPRGRIRVGITSSDDWGSAVPDKSPFMDALYAYLREIDDVGLEGNDRGLWGSMKKYIERQRASNQGIPLIHRYEIPGSYPESDSAFRFKPIVKTKQISELAKNIQK